MNKPRIMTPILSHLFTSWRHSARPYVRFRRVTTTSSSERHPNTSRVRRPQLWRSNACFFFFLVSRSRAIEYLRTACPRAGQVVAVPYNRWSWPLAGIQYSNACLQHFKSVQDQHSCCCCCSIPLRGNCMGYRSWLGERKPFAVGVSLAL